MTPLQYLVVVLFAIVLLEIFGITYWIVWSILKSILKLIIR